MARVTNEQSLLEDHAQRVFAEHGLTAPTFSWTGTKILTIQADRDEWDRATAALGLVQARAADAGFKVLLR